MQIYKENDRAANDKTWHPNLTKARERRSVVMVTPLCCFNAYFGDR